MVTFEWSIDGERFNEVENSRREKHTRQQPEKARTKFWNNSGAVLNFRSIFAPRFVAYILIFCVFCCRIRDFYCSLAHRDERHDRTCETLFYFYHLLGATVVRHWLCGPEYKNSNLRKWFSLFGQWTAEGEKTRSTNSERDRNTIRSHALTSNRWKMEQKSSAQRTSPSAERCACNEPIWCGGAFGWPIASSSVAPHAHRSLTRNTANWANHVRIRPSYRSFCAHPIIEHQNEAGEKNNKNRHERKSNKKITQKKNKNKNSFILVNEVLLYFNFFSHRNPGPMHTTIFIDDLRSNFRSF